MNYRKEIWPILIVVVAVAAVIVYFAAQAVGQLSEIQGQQAAAVDTSSWLTYHNDEYGFSVEYPPNWQIFTSGVAAAEPFIELGNPLSGTTTYAMDILIEQNPQALSSGEYVHQLLAADHAQDLANASSGQLAPTVTPQFKSDYLTTANGNAAFELFDVFEFDHNAEQIYVADGAITLHFDFPVADANPNIAAPANNNAIAHLIVGTLTFE